jgi:hypothetical protein
MLFSCGKTTEDEIADAILSANIELSQSNCQAAIDLLENLGRQNKNAAYLKTLSSAYACRAGYSTVTFFASDLALVAAHAPMGGFTTFSTSSVTVQNPLDTDASFLDLQKAIEILLFAGGIPATTNPLYTERAKYFTAGDAADINSQLMFMEMVQLGKYMRVYGNGSNSGVKGSGTAVNASTCFTAYTGASAVSLAALTSGGGTCATPGTRVGHLQLAVGVGVAARQKRLCHGVILLNGFLDVLPSVVASVTNASLSTLSGITGVVNLAKASDSSLGTVSSTINQTICEDTANVTAANLESYFALLFETLFQ